MKTLTLLLGFLALAACDQPEPTYTPVPNDLPLCDETITTNCIDPAPTYDDGTPK